MSSLSAGAEQGQVPKNRIRDEPSKETDKSYKVSKDDRKPSTTITATVSQAVIVVFFVRLQG